ncbi:hypothetical protein H2200_000028 [Cladophialophora chaetospira]|uniref:Uncharacterized protein n=1 Tax=Cladophialophora chaetospira TaxID=386627 RepID=A0AA38XMM7_9EURO|nr:hypothetical protein H2200_000028 [Cladophialophora chaetospira]
MEVTADENPESSNNAKTARHEPYNSPIFTLVHKMMILAKQIYSKSKSEYARVEVLKEIRMELYAEVMAETGTEKNILDNRAAADNLVERFDRLEKTKGKEKKLIKL